jgi:hypothetical protein
MTPWRMSLRNPTTPHGHIQDQWKPLHQSDGLCLHQYVVVFYIYNTNAIHSVPIKNCSKEELLRAYCKIYAWLTLPGFKPLLHKLNNETSKDIEMFVPTKQTHIQYTPMDNHCTSRNPAKWAICTWKNHFLAGMVGLPKLFPRCRLTAQYATLSMLCPFCQNSLLLAHKALEGLFYFNATPMAPLGTEVIVHMKPNCWCTLGYHASNAWYLSHAVNHCQCI